MKASLNASWSSPGRLPEYHISYQHQFGKKSWSSGAEIVASVMNSKVNSVDMDHVGQFDRSYIGEVLFIVQSTTEYYENTARSVAH